MKYLQFIVTVFYFNSLFKNSNFSCNGEAEFDFLKTKTIPEPKFSVVYNI